MKTSRRLPRVHLWTMSFSVAHNSIVRFPVFTIFPDKTKFSDLPPAGTKGSLALRNGESF
jgi:hypothetical protein